VTGCLREFNQQAFRPLDCDRKPLTEPARLTAKLGQASDIMPDSPLRQALAGSPTIHSWSDSPTPVNSGGQRD
jgi:hypothetical protein